MRSKRVLGTALAAAAVLALLAGLALAQKPAESPLGTVFTYQGQLKSDGTPYTGACDIRFGLFDVSTGGTAIATITKTDVTVDEGYFTVQLDYGTGRFLGQKRWLEMSVRCPAGGGSYTLLQPRQELTASPYGLYAAAAPWSGLTGVPAGFADGVDNDTQIVAGDGLIYTSTIVLAVDTDYIQRRVSGSCSTGNAIRAVGHNGSVTCEPVGAGAAWSLTGNAGTVPGTNYLGTSDNVALEIKVNGQRALRLEPDATSPSLIGGYSGNWLTAGVYGATIAGGGRSSYLNRVTDVFGTVGGGMANQAGDNAGPVSDRWNATVGGGSGNTASGAASTVAGGLTNTASSYYATVGGGSDNTASGEKTTVAGGAMNTAGSAWLATVGGGGGNVASGWAATVPGGVNNIASGQYSFAAGLQAQALDDGAFVWADSTDAVFVSTAPNQFLVRAGGGVGINTDAPAANTLTVGGDGVQSIVSGSSGTGVSGYASATSGLTIGVYGKSVSSDGTGAYGWAANTTGITYGVFGRSDSGNGRGVYGWVTAASGTTSGVFGQSDSAGGRGVYGVSTPMGGTNAGVLGSAASGVSWGVAGWNDNNGAGVGAWSDIGDLIQAYDGDFPGGSLRFKVDQAGNVYADGTYNTFAQADPAGTKHVALYGLSGTEVWIEDLGSGTLVDGRAEVAIDPVYARTVALTETYNVYLTATCQEPVLLFVSEETATFFTVQGVGLDGRPSSCGFDFRLAARRLGFEDLRLEPAEVPAPAPEEGEP